MIRARNGHRRRLGLLRWSKRTTISRTHLSWLCKLSKGLHVVWARSAPVGQECADRPEGRGVAIWSAAHDDHLTRVFVQWA